MMKKINFLMLFASLFLLFSCHTELEFIDQKQDKDSGIGRVISFNELQIKLGKDNISKEFKISNKFNLKNPELTDFIIDQSKIIALENSSSNSNYSMIIHPKASKDDGEFYNLIVQKVNGNISKIIYKYTPETNWYNDYQKNISSPYKGKIDLVYQEGHFPESTSSKVTHCRAEYIEMPCEFGYYHDDAHCEGSGSYFIKITICEDMSGGSSTISYGSASGSTGNGGSNGTIVAPQSLENSFPYGNEYNDAYQSFKFNMHFAPNEKQWLSTHSSASVNLFWYVYNMGSTDEAFIVAKKYIQFAITGQNEAAFSLFPFSWLINFITGNPSVSSEQFYNWFLKPNIDSNTLNEVKNYLTQNGYLLPSFTVNNYPGKEDGMPFEWWKDNNWIKNNIRLDELHPDEEPNSTEKMLFIAFPTQAAFHIKNSKTALSTANQLVSDGTFTGIHNGKADAFRHTFWNALDSSDFGKVITLLFTTAHEKDSGNHPLETQMDLHNNTQGALLGTNYGTFTSASTIKNAVINMMNNTSNIWYLTPLANHDGNNILPSTQIKPTN